MLLGTILWVLLGLKFALGHEGPLKDMLLDRQELSNTSSFSHRHRALPPPSDLALLYKSYLEEPTTPTGRRRHMLWWLCLLVAPADTVKTTCRPSSDCKATVPSCCNKVVSVGSSGGNSKTVTASTISPAQPHDYLGLASLGAADRLHHRLGHGSPLRMLPGVGRQLTSEAPSLLQPFSSEFRDGGPTVHTRLVGPTAGGQVFGTVTLTRFNSVLLKVFA
eukprot:g28081.t1